VRYLQVIEAPRGRPVWGGAEHPHRDITIQN
jgi:hypothetical protein